MKALLYFFIGLMYLGVFGYCGMLLLTTAIHIYQVGPIEWFFGGGIGDAIQIWMENLMQPITWVFIASAGVGFFGVYQVGKRMPRPEPLDEPSSDE